jgi:hypothetical protein
VDCARLVKISREGSIDVLGALDRVISDLPAEHRFKSSQLQRRREVGRIGLLK